MIERTRNHLGAELQSGAMDGLLIALVLGLALIPRLALLHFRGFEIFHADQAVIGLMAHHILQGKFMIYFYGQGYMGSLEAFMAAPIFLVFGMNIFSLQLAPLVFYLLFLVANYHLLKLVFGRVVSLVANLLLALSPAILSQLSVIALGGYPETLFFGTLTLLGLIHAKESQHPVGILFLTGLVAGIGFWVNNLILVYFIALGIFCFLRSNFWKKTCAEGGLRKILLLDFPKIPIFLRIAGLGVHLYVIFFLLLQVISFFSGKEALSLGGLNLKLASPPFPVKQIKKILLTLSIESVVLGSSAVGIKKSWEKVKKSLPLIGGFLLGGSPVFVSTIIGIEGYRVIHGSGMILAKDFPDQFKRVFWNELVHNIFQVPFLKSPWAWAALAVTIGLFVYFIYIHRKEIVKFLGLQARPYPYTVFPFLLMGVVLAICLFSNLQSGRYLIVAYHCVCVIFALALSHFKRYSKVAFWFLFLFLLANNSYGNFRFIKDMPRRGELRNAHDSMIELLKSKDVAGGYAHYITSYVLTFQSREKIVIAPFRSPDRYPAYTRYVDGLRRVAYILGHENAFWKDFEESLKQNKIAYEMIEVKPFSVFIIDRTKGDEKKFV